MNNPNRIITSSSPLAQASATAKPAQSHPSLADQKSNLELAQQRTEGRFKSGVWLITIAVCVCLIGLYFYKTYTLDLNKLDLKNWFVVPLVASPLIAGVFILIALLKSIGQTKSDASKADDNSLKELIKIITNISK